MSLEIVIPDINGSLEAGLAVGTDPSLSEDRKIPIVEASSTQTASRIAAKWAYFTFRDSPDIIRRAYVSAAVICVQAGLCRRIGTTLDGDWRSFNSEAAIGITGAESMTASDSSRISGMITKEDIQKALTLIIATKATWWLTNHHTGPYSVFNLADEFERTKLLEKYERHINNKTLARDLKIADKERAQNDKNLCVACFDLQKVLATPQSNVSDFYYKSKYATYNFTIYDIGRNDGYCYVWHEEIAKRGSNEIASCLWNFLELQKSKGIETVILYSDNCGGQNRNHVVFSMFVYAATKFQIKITHRFLEKGHTQNEGDSMHAVIENAKKRQSVIYVPEQWITLIRMAKTTGKVYNVTEMSQDDFFDFKAVAANQNWKTDSEKNPVQISQIREINFSHETPRTASFKYDFNSDLKTCDVQKIRRGRPINIANNHPPKLYDSFLPIDGKKLTGLLWLSETGKIPSMYHAFYKNLRSKNSTCSEDKDESVEEEEIE